MRGDKLLLTLRMREKDNPVVTDPVVELDVTLGGFSFKVWSNASETETITEARVSLRARRLSRKIS